MAPQHSTGAEPAARERRVLDRLLALYGEQKRIYVRVLELSRRQGEIVAGGGSLAQVRQILEEKRRCLQMISRLDLTERSSKFEWEQGRSRWSAAGKARLHEALSEVTALIEEILGCEERNDMELIERTQVV